jgi:hypothetical protein
MARERLHLFDTTLRDGAQTHRRGGQREVWAKELTTKDLYQSRLANGAAAIEAVLKTKPDAYLKVVASLLPKDVNLSLRPPEQRLSH